MTLSTTEIDFVRGIAGQLAARGANLTLELPGGLRVAVGARPDAARVVFHGPDAVAPLVRGDHLRLAEAYLHGRIDITGEMAEVLRVTELVELEPSRFQKLRFALQFWLRDRERFDRESIAFHYDRPPEFFLPWLDGWRSYSHGIYRSPDDSVTDAQSHKLELALDALGLEPGMRVFDMGGGWGCLLEYAGRRGIRVESITISDEQFRFCEGLIRDHGLPCTIEQVDFHAFRPRGRYDAIVFMGTLEHVPDYRRVARFVAEHLEPHGRLWADFCAQRASFQVGDFMRSYIWPGTATYVDPARLIRELVRAGLNVWELADDTLSYARTVRDWAKRLEAVRAELAAKWGEPVVRAFLLYLWGSHHFLATNRTQAYHLVAALHPAPVGRNGQPIG